MRPSASILPQVGISGGTPRPRKLSDASEMIADAIEKVPITTADGKQVRHDMAQDDAGMPSAERTCRIDELARPQRKRLSARHSAVRDPTLADEREDQVFQPLTEERHDGDRQQQRRERPNDLDELLNQEIDRSGEVTRDRAKDDAEHAGNYHDHHGDHQRDTGAVEQSGQDIPSDRVSAERMRTENQAGGRNACERFCAFGS